MRLPHALTTHSPHASQLALAAVNGFYVSVVQISHPTDTHTHTHPGDTATVKQHTVMYI